MAFLFMALASPMAFQAVRSILGGFIATQEGLPKIGGLAVHALVFMVLSTMIWRYVPFGSSNFEGDDEEFRRRRRASRRRKAARASNSDADYDGGAPVVVDMPPGF